MKMIKAIKKAFKMEKAKTRQLAMFVYIINDEGRILRIHRESHTIQFCNKYGERSMAKLTMRDLEGKKWKPANFKTAPKIFLPF